MKTKVAVLLLCTVCAILPGSVTAVRFILAQEECFDETVEYDGDNVHVSFVVIRAQSTWAFNHPISGIDLTIDGPNNFRQEVFDKSAEKLEFEASHRGSYKICLRNKSPYPEMVDLTIRVGHIPYYDQKVQDEHIDPLINHIARLGESIYEVQLEQHWLYAQTEQQAILNDNLSRRLVYRAFSEAAALVFVSATQVYLLRRLFDKKLNQSRV